MSHDRKHNKYVVFGLPVILLVSILLMTNVASAISPTVSASPAPSTTPLWGFQGASMNYTGTQKNNTPLSNSTLNSITPQWLFNGSYANYTFQEKISSLSLSGTDNATIIMENSTSVSIKFVVNYTEKISGFTNKTTYLNGSTIAEAGGNFFSFTGPNSTSNFPALSTSALYFMDSGILSSFMSTATIHIGVSFPALKTNMKSDKVIMNFSGMNISYYASYNSGLILNISGNNSAISFNSQISATNALPQEQPPFSLGPRTSTSYTKYEITSLASNGNFTVNVTGNSSSGSFFGSSSSSFNGTINKLTGFPALNTTNLSQLNAGISPFPYYTTVTTNVTVSVAAGTFVTDELHGSITTNGNISTITIYVDATSGVVVRLEFNASFSFGSLLMFMNESLSLTSTNIPMTGGAGGYLSGTVSPSGATLIVNGIAVPVQNGTYNVSLEPGHYYVSATMNGYQAKTYGVNITAGVTTEQNVVLSPIAGSVTISGTVTPSLGSVVFVGGHPAYVNQITGDYSISVAKGNYTISAFHSGYFPVSKNITATASQTENFVLVKVPTATSVKVNGKTNATGYNVTIANVANMNGFVTANFTATKNGTLSVSIPFSDMKNATVADILNSSVYVNGTRDRNFSITFSSNFTIILTVYNLSGGDPTLYWTYSPSAVLPSSPSSSPPSISPLEDGVVIGVLVAVIAAVAVMMVKRRKK